MDRPGLNRVVIAEFDRLAFLTPLEMEILTTRAAGKSQKWQERNLHKLAIEKAEEVGILQAMFKK